MWSTPKKSQFTPTRELEFLGFTINSQTMEIKLPGEKLKRTRAEAQHLQTANNPTAQMLSWFLGKLNAATNAIPPAPLFYRNLQKSLTRGGQNHSTRVHLNPEAQEEFQWWEEHLSRWNGRSLITHKPALTMDTDVSLRGWGAVCQGIRTGGPWSTQEKNLHINCLELLEGRDDTAEDGQHNGNCVHQQQRVTISPELNHLAKDLWLWCLERDISLTAQHLPGIQNTIADEESRVMKDRSDWKLCPAVFRNLS